MALLIFPLGDLMISLFVLPSCLLLLLKLIYALFLNWVLPKTVCLTRLVFFPVCWHRGRVCSCAFRISLKYIQLSWTLVSLKIAYQGTLTTSPLNRSKCPSELQGSSFADFLLLQELKTHNSFWLLCSRWPLTTTSPTNPSLFKQTAGPVGHQPLFSPSPTMWGNCPPGTSWTTFSLLCCISSRHLVNWNPLREEELVIVRILPTVYRLFQLPLHLGGLKKTPTRIFPFTLGTVIIFKLITLP